MNLRFPGYRRYAAAMALIWLLCGASDPYDLIRAETTLAAQLNPKSYIWPITYVASLPFQGGRRDCPD